MLVFFNQGHWVTLMNNQTVFEKHTCRQGPQPIWSWCQEAQAARQETTWTGCQFKRLPTSLQLERPQLASRRRRGTGPQPLLLPGLFPSTPICDKRCPVRFARRPPAAADRGRGRSPTRSSARDLQAQHTYSYSTFRVRRTTTTCVCNGAVM